MDKWGEEETADHTAQASHGAQTALHQHQLVLQCYPSLVPIVGNSQAMFKELSSVEVAKLHIRTAVLHCGPTSNTLEYVVRQSLGCNSWCSRNLCKKYLN